MKDIASYHGSESQLLKSKLINGLLVRIVFKASQRHEQKPPNSVGGFIILKYKSSKIKICVNPVMGLI
ncbi:hypothetical protein J4731_15310 [Providencia rettgeri]|nr:hypothetical protein [Providencia rettgeri]